MMTTATSSESSSFLDGGGEMGELIRSYDWSGTSLGSPEQWPQSLRSVLSICLTSNFPIAIYWGKELTLFYNDAWSSIPGDKHPWALGKKAIKVWPEIWNDIEPQFQKAFKGESGGSKDALLPMHRHGYTEECYFDFTFTPVYGEAGKVEGIFNAVIETTYRVINEGRSDFLNRLTVSLSGVQSQKLAIEKLMQFLRDNNKPVTFAMFYGSSSAGPNLIASTFEAKKFPLYESFPFENAYNVGKLCRIDDLHKFFTEVPKGFWPEEPSEAVIIPLKNSKDEIRNFIVCGLSARRRFDTNYSGFFESLSHILANIFNTILSLEEEKKRSALVDSITDAIIGTDITDSDYRITSWNKGAEAIYGWKASEVIGRPVRDIVKTASHTDEIRHSKADRIRQDGHISEEVIQMHKDGRLLNIHASVTVIRDEKGNAIGAVAVNRDITEKKKIEQAYLIAKEQLEMTFTNIPAGVYQFNSKGKIEYINSKGAELMGYNSIEEVLSCNDMEQLRQHMHDTYLVLDESGNELADKNGSTYRAFATGKHAEVITQFINKQTGKIFWLLSNSTPLYSERGELSFVLTTATDITVQKIAEHRVRESEQYFRSSKEQLEQTFKSIPAGVYLVGPGAEMMFANDIAAKMAGFASPEEMVRMKDPVAIVARFESTFEVFDENESILAMKDTPVFQTLVTRKPSEAVIKIVRRTDGTYMWLLSRSTPMLNEDGTILRVLIISTDVTQQKIAEQEIKRSEGKFRDLSIDLEGLVRQRTEELTIKNRQLNEAQQIASLGSWEWDVLTDGFHWSDNLYNIYGVDTHEMISFGKFIELVHPGDRGYVQKILEASHKEKRFQEFYHRIITPDGTVKTLHARGEIVFNREGSVVKIVGTSQDVTAQKNIEDKLIDTNEKLEQRNAFVEKLINSSPDLIMVLDKKLRFITLNKAAESKIQPFFQSRIIGKKVTEINPSLENTDNFRDLVKAFDGEIIVRNKVKSTISDRFYEHNYIPLTDGTGDVYAVMVISHDITENIRQLEALKKLNESDQLKSDFIKMASHELKTPVTSAKGYVQLLLSAMQKDQDKALSPSLIKLSLVSIDKQISRLTRLLSELLDLSKIEAGKLELHKEEFNVNELVIETVQDVLYSHSKHDINIFHNFGCNVYGDKDRIGQVLINLLTNAIKYSPNNDKVEVRIDRSINGSVSVSVKDHGIGIDKQYHDKIFERFYRVQGKEEQTYPGFGIGLFIAKEILQQHDASISFTSEKGKGSVFSFTMPILR